ncbi:MAG: DUF5123 domain-containing protein [Melioribacteraceae bacterium]|nr:DUF5123 domain-containing protein [Melioribacteraceae bacterium]
MRKYLLLLLLLTGIISSQVIGQTLVLPGEGALSQAIADAADGDVLQLLSGAEYTETGTEVANLAKSITIEMEGTDPEAVKPKVFFTADGGTENAFFNMQDGSSITLRGIEFDGRIDGSIAAEHLIRADVTENKVYTTINKIVIDNCYVHHFNDNMVDAGNSAMKTLVLFDSTFVNNCVVHDIATSLYYKYSGENYIEITNSTFYRLTSYGLRIAGPGESGDYDHTAAAYIDRTTWYDMGSLDGREILLLEKGPNMNPWIVKNSIFQKQWNKGKIVINLKDLPDNISTVTNICYWDVGDRNWRNNIIGDTLMADPSFADPDNGDFTLPEGSVLYTFADDGGAIGDPRWATNATSVETDLGLVPEKFALAQNYPNPFNPSTSIEFSILNSGFVSLKIYDLLGKEIAVLVDKQMQPGTYRYKFDANNLPSGIYLYKLAAGNNTLTRKMALIK